jgi:hypothetical protein
MAETYLYTGWQPPNKELNYKFQQGVIVSIDKGYQLLSRMEKHDLLFIWTEILFLIRVVEIREIIQF